MILANTCPQNNTSFLRHKDVFRLYALPRMNSPRTHWDNHCNDDRGPTESLEGCRVICEADQTCLQYQVNAESKCLTTSQPNVGQSATNITSDWILERVQEFYDQADECEGVKWIS